MISYTPLIHALVYFFHMDKANAAIHAAPVKFSPLTFGLLAVIRSLHAENFAQDVPGAEAVIAELLEHEGQYALDSGR